MRQLGGIRGFGSAKITVILSVVIIVILMSGAITRPTLLPNSFKFATSVGILSQDSSCPRLNFSKQLLPKTALASFPGSGNTWMRHLLQQMTGILTGARYNDHFLRHHGFPGEGVRDGRVVAIKTHVSFTPVFDRCILLIRNPFEAFIAEFNRRYSQKHNQTGFVHLDEYIKLWNDYFEQMCGYYKSFHMSWLKHKNVHLVLYSGLKTDLSRELHRTLAFLQNSTQITGNVQCALYNSTGIVKRNHSKSLPYQFFYSREKKGKLNRIIREVSNAYSSRFPEESVVMRKWMM